MKWRYYAAISLLLSAMTACPVRSDEVPKTPAFTTVAELSSGFHSLYAQDFSEARQKFDAWESQHPEEPFGQVAIAASYVFEEIYREGVLYSDFFLNEKRFLHGIEGKPDPERMNSFQDALERARKLAKGRLAKDKRDPEAIFALTLAAGMESNSDMMLKKKHIDSLKRLKEGNEYAKELLAQEPDANDAYVALGSANYIIGSLSGGTRFFLMFGGIHGNKNLVMHQLGNAIDEAQHLQPVAQVLLALAARR